MKYNEDAFHLSVQNYPNIQDGDDSITKSFSDFNQLPLKYQRAILDILKAKVKEYQEVVAQEEAEKICTSEGHQFSKWKKGVDVQYEDTYIDHQFIPNYRTETTVWERTCSRCGFVERVEHEPQELIDTRREKNKQAQVRRLTKKLQQLQSKSE